jgi:hypothetical protein
MALRMVPISGCTNASSINVRSADSVEAFFKRQCDQERQIVSRRKRLSILSVGRITATADQWTQADVKLAERRLFAHVGAIPNACRTPKRLLSVETELCDGACGNPNTAARRSALIVRLEFETAEPLSVQGPAVFSKLTLCETRSLTLVALRHCLRIALS